MSPELRYFPLALRRLDLGPVCSGDVNPTSGNSELWARRDKGAPAGTGSWVLVAASPVEQGDKGTLLSADWAQAGGPVAPQLPPATLNSPACPSSQIHLQCSPFLAAGVSCCPTPAPGVNDNKATECEPLNISQLSG